MPMPSPSILANTPIPLAPGRTAWWMPAVALASAGVIVAAVPREPGVNALGAIPRPTSEPRVLPVTSAPGEALTLQGTLRTFARFDSLDPAAHPDFQQYASGLRQGLVLTSLGPSGKPNLADPRGFLAGSGRRGATNAVHSKSSFADWFDGPGIPTSLTFKQLPTGHFAFAASDDPDTRAREGFFPLNPTQPAYFTLELPAQFRYRRGTDQSISLAATDDAWVFIGGTLAIDLGGTHPRLEACISIDDLADRVGFRDGQPLPVRIFVANRRAGRSDLDIRTTMPLEPDSGSLAHAR